ncbi:MAG: PAS domain S-box protein [Candidatus Hydrogenedentes bacterium]|nr:PAS domain S-box protein [Candidatus Hydrogenedentota bacterium]
MTLAGDETGGSGGGSSAGQRAAAGRLFRSPAGIWARLFAPDPDSPSNWLWVVGVSRVSALLLLAFGVRQLIEERAAYGILGGIYLAALLCGLLHLVTLRASGRTTPWLTWTQVLLDFSVVAATVGFSGGQASIFTFLLVVVILEAGVLMGLFQGFFHATLSGLFMLLMALQTETTSSTFITHWYQFSIQAVAFFCVAFISGYWNQRISRLREFQRDILDNMSGGFLLVDPKGRVIGANQAACGILGMKGQEIEGRPIGQTLVPETGAECPVVTALREERDYTNYEFTAATADGSSRLLGLSTNRILDRRGRLHMVIASFNDLTEIERMRKELRDHDRTLAIGHLAAELAHEIRNPVTSIRGAMEELGRGAGSPELAARLAAISIRESDHLNEIVTGFLDFARNPRIKREILLPRDFARDMKLLFEGRHPGVRVEVRDDSGGAVIEGDPTQIRQLFLNLCQNAMEAMGGRGAIQIVISALGGMVGIHFNDRGPGIPPDKVACVFEPFYTEKERGVGMGLPVCNRIVAAHNGTIQVAARPGGGASVVVRLPRAQNPV